MSLALAVALSAALLATMGVALGVLAAVVARHRSTPGSTWFAGLLATLSAGLVLTTGVGLATDFASPRWLSTLYVVVLLTPIPWVGFVARFTGRGTLVTPRRLLWVATPLLAGVGVVLSPPVTGRTGGVFLLGVLVVFFYAVMLVFAAGALLVRTTSLYSHLSLAQGVAPSVALVEPWFVLTVVFQSVDRSVPVTVGVVTAGMGLATVLLAVSVVRLDLLETAAAPGTVGREAVLQEVDEVVLVTDDAGRVVDLNATARRTLGVEESAVLGEPVASVLGTDTDTLEGDSTVELYTAAGYRTFETGVSTLSDQHGRPFGRVYTLSDVTRREVRQGQLQVLNRVLRHDLRNKMDVVEALAGAVESPPSVGDRIQTAAEDLLATSERARELESSTTATPVETRPVDLRELVESVADATRERYPAVSLTVSAPAASTVRSDPSVLRSVVSNLVENAAEHNDADDPTVSVTVTAVDPDDRGRVEAAGERAETDVQGGVHDGGGTGVGPDDRRMVEVAVADDGPGISEHERAVVERGEETPLQHASGLGLWTARWGTRVLGGDLVFEENDPRGTVVRVRLPVRDDPGGDAAVER
jgi:signal transduction histidine kinase